MGNRKKVEFIESYIKIGNSSYQWNDNHGELIRCGDCKHRPKQQNGAEINGQWCYWCELHHAWRTDDWFCADGERG